MLILEAGSGSGVVVGRGGGRWRCQGAAADFIIPRTGIFCSAALMAPAPPQQFAISASAVFARH